MSPPTSIALLSMTCRFPDAVSSGQLWANIAEGRRSFRAIPSERIDINRYAVKAIGKADSITHIRAGLLTNWMVDRSGLRISKNTFATTDLTHWLALELAAEAIAAIGGPDRIDRARTAVIVANTLTGEFSRAALLRLRLPFLEDVLAQASDNEGLPTDVATRLRNHFAAELRQHFPDPNEDSLAGGLANTIAGRIANYFDLRGGAYSVDGACASSLVALADAANLLVSGQADAVVVAAVDLSLDPFELVGFSRNGALAAGDMCVFDVEANGFWPGEGGACVVLMRQADAATRGLPILARIRGWGLSSDGAGGLTRPSTDGQVTAYRRAYEMAGVSPADIAFVEAHGTGTAVGDPIEVRALAALRDGARSSLPIGSIKANIGHTKAAAGLAGLIKAVEALRHGLVPPHVSCTVPHPVFAEVDDSIRPILACELIDDRKGAVAGVSSFGFGGINAHIVIESVGLTAPPVSLPRAPVLQDAELFLFSDDSADEVVGSIEAFERRAAALSMAEFTDAAAHVTTTAKHGSVRVAIVACHGSELAERLARAKAAVMSGHASDDLNGGVFVGRPSRPPRVGFLFPGQGAPYRPDGGVWRRFGDASRLLARLPSSAGCNCANTEIAQPAIVAASLAALSVLGQMGVSACIAAGHSLGEITALSWAEALDQETTFALALKRGSIMGRIESPLGAMLRVALSRRDAEQLAQETGTAVACRNGPNETVLSGTLDAIELAAVRCCDCGIEVSKLAVSHAFHSPHMKSAAEAFLVFLKSISIGPIRRPVASTITGEPLTPHSDLRRLLVDQLMEPVLFDAALTQVAAQSDCLVEVGPGQGLMRLAQSSGIPAFSVDAFGVSIKPLLLTAGALFAAGINIRSGVLFDDRYIRTFKPASIPSFIESPCGSRAAAKKVKRPVPAPPAMEEPPFEELSQESDPLVVALSAIAHETGLESSKIGAEDRFLDALHLNSLAVTRIVTAAAKALGIRVPSTPTEFANATPRQLADALAELRAFGSDLHGIGERIAGVRPWVRTYGMKWVKGHVPLQGTAALRWCNMTIGQQIPSSLTGDGRAGLSIWIDRQFGTAVAERLVALVAEAARAGVHHLALCHNRAPIAAFARSIAREGYFQSIRIIDRSDADASDPRLATVLSTDVGGYYEVRLSDDGGIEEPVFVPIDQNSSPFAAITADDVVVIVGGGKGIAAECALHIARCGAIIVLVGRSAADDPAIAATLTRAERNGLRCRYVCADVLKPESLSIGLAPILEEYGPATTLVYAPAVNEPKRLTELDVGTVRRTLAPKTVGLELTLEALGPRLRRLITFGSIVGRTGLEGEAHYALANAMQTAATDAWAAAWHGRAALAIEWSVWGGTGMGERLGTIERLSAQGVDAISVDDALDAFDQMIAYGAIGTVAVTSRFGPPTDLSLGPIELPMLRFVDEPKVHFPGVELVIETTLSRARDVYLDDHVVAGHAVLPAVMGLEAMAQVASALTPLGPQITISNLALYRALNIPAAGTARIRIAALRSERQTTEVHLFADDDGFASPCMQASFSAGKISLTELLDAGRSILGFPAEKLYGPLFFNGNRFQRLEHFETVTSRRVSARLRSDEGANWFSSYEPSLLVLWDPGATDAALHALQVATPHWRVLPVSAERIGIDSEAGPLKYVSAIERKTSKNTYTFDLIVSDANGRVGQRWTNVTFRAVDRTDIGEVLESAPALAAAYLERVARETLGDDTIEVSLVCDGDSSRESRRNAAVERLGLSGKIDRRVDGRPIRIGGKGSISIAHRGDMTLAIAASQAVGCDIEYAGAAEPDISFVRRHAALEVCRKLGRKPSSASIQTLIPGTAARVDDLTVITLELPRALGSRIVAFGCLLEAPAAKLPDNYSAINEVAS